MSPRRRTVLAAVGSTAAALSAGVGYWQRHRLRRRDETDAIEAALGIDPPAVETSVAVTDAHLHASYSRARDHIEETASLLDSAADASGTQHSRRARAQLDDAHEDLDASRPSELTDDEVPLEILTTYRLAIAGSAWARSVVHDGSAGPPSEALHDASEALRADLDGIEPQYRGSSLSAAVVQCGEADEMCAVAASRASRAQRFLDDSEYSHAVTWEVVETARQTVYDADWLFDEQDGRDRTGALADAFERLTDRVDTDTENVTSEYEDGVRSHAAARLTDRRLSGTAPETHFDAGRPALAVREQAQTAMIAATLDSLAGFPSTRALDGSEHVLTDDSEPLLAAKRDATEALTAAADEAGVDPLGRYLLAEAIDTADRGDRQLTRLLDNVNSYDHEAWVSRRDTAYLRFRAAAAEARAVPDVVELVNG
ncbi:uncharacterized protein NP_4088A [Natronomonas pharaonis DSM 2160]|uniref:Uncharacterized protein n=1 Tax=Natronomonas pharaonis (strain ATCC 35678 / DSM 2160 / CIP 103997 / JCM 8858 / NBRC 14720 / NCIMB 2260 / Gabara) TaxID=348780 RepID=A0A1U7EY35_NATPD|nr:hypothetical protein [Natronomonas pharaonis]CAI50135.1 uncharacterized protein NP_4088A [Natronomonas pharaonis DSM 2160]